MNMHLVSNLSIIAVKSINPTTVTRENGLHALIPQTFGYQQILGY